MGTPSIALDSRYSLILSLVPFAHVFEISRRAVASLRNHFWTRDPRFAPEVRSKVQVDILQAAAGFKRFYLDLALSSTPAQLNGLLDFTEPDKILFGSDFPYAAQYAIDALVLQYEAFVRSSPRGYKLTNDVLRRNALRLLQKHQQGKKFEERTAFEVVNDLV